MLAKFPLSVFTLLLGFAITQNFGCTTQKDNSAIAQTSPKPTPQEIVQPGEVLALPGKLDNIPVFNSNSPEWIKIEGILLSFVVYATLMAKVNKRHAMYIYGTELVRC
ncbi:MULTISPECIES: DUF3370 family protein [unclassified Nostoc]|uniref:DUF3370 family protein n=1 Tax=unclassified Nostoc TaxID=2593658 RepID=UPI002AD317D4|nr:MULTISPECIES: DUF3370 family protein [unclassified Nostoc]MDZ8126021.1 DUF3370 family protein [Nostoc sp. CmiVER01]MDZ8226039.1 DUF3370 family protein [Nostoc sp. ChiVER01]